MILLKTTIIVINGIFCTFVNCPVFAQAAANWLSQQIGGKSP
jgi:hypothetical protein